MATIVRHEKLPANQRRAGVDAVTPSVRGRQGVIPSTIGIAAQKRFARLAQVAKVTTDALKTLNTIRDSEEAEQNPELAALVNDPKFMAVIGRVVAKIGREVDEITGSGEKPLTSSSLSNHRMSQEERVHRIQALANGQDTARPILGAEDLARVEAARAKLARLRIAEAIGDAGDIVRARFGMDERPATDEDLMKLGRPAEWKFKPRG
ncbi:hypothetical protein EVC45_02400 [Paraburkholderia sp. UYCP14C]|uniref:hypothetical protein n=1 Tax=Paraburkholderia sp. UYCP14C TaxID=2511130 RepID=UPI00101F5956|nr:hypothetical protein [Paraburkholderia sp. UYCP14C]RZF31323.1 hypothetical protein EVC45_02400 [Paraburkholderia sp. UYCP14C]